MGKKLGTILFDSVTDLETSQESFLNMFYLCQARRGNLTLKFKFLAGST